MILQRIAAIWLLISFWLMAAFAFVGAFEMYNDGLMPFVVSAWLAVTALVVGPIACWKMWTA